MINPLSVTFPLNKLFDLEDFHDPVISHWISLLREVELQVPSPKVPTAARYWEYAQALRAAVCVPGQVEILEIGGSDSVLMPALMSMEKGLSYTSVETPEWISANSERRKQQCPQPLAQLPYLPVDEQFDVVLAISVIEHIEEDAHELIHDWAQLVKPGGVLFLTSDVGQVEKDFYMFHWMRLMKLNGQRVIWTPETWGELAKLSGFAPIGPEDWAWHGGPLFCDGSTGGGGYTFGALALRRKL